MSEKPYTGRNDPDLHPEPAPARQSHNGSGAEGLSGTDEPKDYQFRSTTVPAQLHYDAISEVEQPKKKWWSSLLVAGSAPQIVLAALVAIAIGLGVSSAVERVPQSALDLVNIPGRLWLRALTAVGESPPETDRARLKRSPSSHHHGNDPCYPAAQGDVAWRQRSGQVDTHVLLLHHRHRHLSFPAHDCTGMATFIHRGRRRKPAGSRRQRSGDCGSRQARDPPSRSDALRLVHPQQRRQCLVEQFSARGVDLRNRRRLPHPGSGEQVESPPRDQGGGQDHHDHHHVFNQARPGRCLLPGAQ